MYGYLSSYTHMTHCTVELAFLKQIAHMYKVTEESPCTCLWESKIHCQIHEIVMLDSVDCAGSEYCNFFFFLYFFFTIE